MWNNSNVDILCILSKPCHFFSLPYTTPILVDPHSLWWHVVARAILSDVEWPLYFVG